MDVFSFPAWFIAQSRCVKRVITLVFDFVILLFSLWLAFSLRLGEFYWPESEVVALFIAAPFIAIPVFIKLGLYRAIIRYIGFHSLWAVVRAISLYGLLLSAVVLLGNVDAVPRSVHIINWLIALLLVGGSRMIATAGGLLVCF